MYVCVWLSLLYVVKKHEPFPEWLQMGWNVLKHFYVLCNIFFVYMLLMNKYMYWVYAVEVYGCR